MEDDQEDDCNKSSSLLTCSWTLEKYKPTTSRRYERFVTDLHVSPSTKSKIANIIHLMCNQLSHENIINTKAISLLLKDCCHQCHIDSVVSCTNYFGYDLMQMFAAYGLFEMVEYTLHLGYDICLLARPCSSPLHLACKANNLNVIRLFLDHGADINIESTACFPAEHSNSLVSPACAYDSQRASQSHCIAKRHTLIALALESDNVQMIRFLMQADYLKHLDTNMALYYACQNEAVRCLEFMIPLLPDQANQRYDFPQNCSLFSVAFAKSVNCGRVLLESDITWEEDIILHVNSLGESLLHLVLQYPHMPFFYSMVQVTLEKYLLKTHINAIDCDGNSPLLVLLEVYGKQVTVKNQIYERHMNEQMLDIVRYLVQQGANVHVRNKAGKNVLHVLLHDEYYPTVYVQSLQHIIQVIEYLLDFDIDINSHATQVVHPLTWTIKILSTFNVYSLEAVWPSLGSLIRLLLDHGGDPNQQVEKGIHIVNVVLNTVSHWLKQCITDVNLECAFRVLHHMTSLIHELFQHGMQLSGDVLELCIKQIMILCNVSIPLEALIQSDILVQHIGTLLALFFVHGNDPHRLEMVCQQQTNTTPCQLHALFYMSRAFIVHRHTSAMFQILSLLQFSLDQSHLNNFIDSLCLVLSNNFNPDHELFHCIKHIRGTNANPRSLQSLCKVVINKQLEWRLWDSVPLLKLPKSLHSYLLFHIGA